MRASLKSLAIASFLAAMCALSFPASALATDKGIYTPSTVTLGDNTSSSTVDTGVATYVGRDMYIGGKYQGTGDNHDQATQQALNTTTLDGWSNYPAGSYAVEAEGLTVVRGKLALNPLKASWNSQGFRFGTVGFGAQYRPADNSTVLAVAGIGSAIGSMKTYCDGGNVGAWKNGAWVGQQRKRNDTNTDWVGEYTGYTYKAQIAGDKTYVMDTGADNNKRQSVVSHQTWWSDDLVTFNTSNPLSIDGTDYSEYGTDITTLSKELASLSPTSTTVTVGAAPASSSYMRFKYNYDGNHDSGCDVRYGFTFAGDSTFSTSYEANANAEKCIWFKGDGTSSLQVFNVSSDQLSSSGWRGVDFAFSNIPSGASIVINVSGSTVDFHTGWRFWWAGSSEDVDWTNDEISNGYVMNTSVQYDGKNVNTVTNSQKYSTACSSIMWNFTNTTQLTIEGGIAIEGTSDGKTTQDDPAAAVLGSILVPSGSFECHVTTNGRVYVGQDFSMYNPTKAASFDQSGARDGASASVIDMDQERHNFPWSWTDSSNGAAVSWSKVDASDSSKLAGSEWTIYSESDCADGHKLVSITDNGANDSDPTPGVITYKYLVADSSNGSAARTGVTAYTYYIKETKAPVGYSCDNTVYEVTTSNTGNTLNYVSDVVSGSGSGSVGSNGAIPNSKITGSAEWSKVDSEVTTQKLPGSSWTLTKVSTESASMSWTIKDGVTAGGNGMLDDTDTTDGSIKVSNLEPGTYLLAEAEAPTGYTKSADTYAFVVSSSGTTTWKTAKERISYKDASGNDVSVEVAAASPATGLAVANTPTPVVVSRTIPVKKTVANTVWPTNANGNYVEFQFALKPTGVNAADAPMPEGATGSGATLCIAPTDGATGTEANNIVVYFDNITFDASSLATDPGTSKDYAKTYTYTIAEAVPDSGTIADLRYSRAEWQVQITVKRAIEGDVWKGLTTSAKMAQTKDDQGNDIASPDWKDLTTVVEGSTPANTAAFTNTKVLTNLPITGSGGWTGHTVLGVGLAVIAMGVGIVVMTFIAKKMIPGG